MFQVFFVIQKLDDQIKCCWMCIFCKENEIMMDFNMCKVCVIGWWLNEELIGIVFIVNEIYMYIVQKNEIFVVIEKYSFFLIYINI